MHVSMSVPKISLTTCSALTFGPEKIARDADSRIGGGFLRFCSRVHAWLALLYTSPCVFIGPGLGPLS
jgi:hypothetical protein